MPQPNHLAEQLFGQAQQQQPMGIIETLAQGLKEGVTASMDGIGKAYDLAQSSPALNHMASMGSHEIAAALFTGNQGGSAFVMYGRGAREDASLDKGIHGGAEPPAQDQEQQHERGGRTM